MATHKGWQGSTDGSARMHRMLINAIKLLGLWPIYFATAVVVVPMYMLLRHQGYIVTYHYLRRRHGFGPLKAFCYVYLNHYRFGQVVIDRFAVYAGVKFKFDVENYDDFLRLCESDKGIVIFSSHIGNYELAGYTFHSSSKSFNALVFPGESPTVMENRRRVLAEHNIGMISVKDDMSHVFEVNAALAGGQIISVPGDRMFGSSRTIECTLLGAKAEFPLGPYSLASQREVNIVAIFVMKEKMHKYKVFIRQLRTDGPMTHGRSGKAAALAQAMAAEMETVLKKYPEQWYNYYEFWK